MSQVIIRGKTIFRPWYLHRKLINRINHKIALENIRKYPQIAIFAFDNIGLVINLEGRYESDSLEVLGEFLTQHLRVDTNSTVLDIGANIGNHSLFFASIFKNVVAFEPNPQVYNLLKLNTAGSNIRALNYGVSSRNMSLTFSINATNLGASAVIGVGGSGRGEFDGRVIEIPVRRLDDDPNIAGEAISLLKIDVEGHELEVLRGAEALIRVKRPVIVFEQAGKEFRHGTSEVIEHLRNRNYRFFTIQGNLQFGRGVAARSISLGLRLLFGFRKDVVATTSFDQKFHEMIIAVPILTDFGEVSKE